MADSLSASFPGAGSSHGVPSDRGQEQDPVAEQFVSVDLTCPACKSRFSTLQPKTTAIRPRRGKEYDEFLYTEYDGPNPSHYSVLVCPACLYAAYKGDFDDLAARVAIQADKQARKEQWGNHTFTGLRDGATAQASYELAVRCYEHHRRRRLSMQGALHLEMAWLAYEEGDRDKAQSYMMQAYSDYSRSYAEEAAASVEGELRRTYILGLLAAQLGNPGEALTWLEATTKQPDLKKYPEMERRVRGRWSALREATKST